MVLMGSGVGGVTGSDPAGAPFFSFPKRTTVTLGEAEDCGVGVAFGNGIPPNSITADAVGIDPKPFLFPPMISSAIVGILKFGAFNIGCETDSV